MTMRLASEPTLISHGGNTVRLRPSLRAAYLLQSNHGLAETIDGLFQARLDIVLAVVQATADDPALAHSIIARTVVAHGARGLAAIARPLELIVLDSFGIDQHQHPGTTRRSSKPFDMLKALAELFEIATGWLEWTPTDAWAATPAEIMAAHRGLIAKLRAIHGSADQDTNTGFDPQDEPSREEIQAGIRRLRYLSGQRLGDMA